MRRLFPRLTALATLAVLATGLAQPASGQQVLKAAAVVNDEVISVLDLEMRVRLVSLSADLSSEQVQSRQFRQQILQNLIREQLQLQAAERAGFEVSDEELDQAIARVARNNNMSPEEFLSVLRRNDVMPQTFRDQIRASLAWQKLISNRLARQVDISEEDVDDMVERMRARQGERQYQVREIFLALDDDANGRGARQTARRLVQQLRQGAQFAALARQFSQAPTAADGGLLGWVVPDNLPEAVAETVTQMRPGEIAGPVESFSGLHVIELADTRVIDPGNEAVDLLQLFMPVPDGAGPEAADEVRARLNELAEPAEGCSNFLSLADDTDAARTSDLGEVRMTQLPDGVRQKVAELEVEQASQPMEVAGGLAVLMVCERTGGIDRQQIRRNLQQERLNMLSQRYMRDLRRQANIDVRL
jgi:peptidyl-prolyl cis-trans isomerase SurA